MIKISIVVPYKELYTQVESYLQQIDSHEFEIELTHYVGSQNDFITNCNADIVVARGITSKALACQNKNVHSVEISITGRDLITALWKSRKAYGKKKVGFVVTDEKLCNPSQLEYLTGMAVAVREAVNEHEVFAAIDGLRGEGVEVFIGGLTLSQRCEKLGYPHVHIKTGNESITHAINEAVATARSLERERARANLITAVLNNTEDVMFALNRRGVVIAANTKATALFLPEEEPQDREDAMKAAGGEAEGSALKTFSVRPEQPKREYSGSPLIPSVGREGLEGCRIHDVYPECGWRGVLDKQEDAELLHEINGQLMLVKMIPIMVNSESVGVLVTCRTVEAIRQTEHKIRKVLSEKGLAARYSFQDIICRNERMKRLIATAYKYSQADSNVLILGETGTGKELFAQSIHNASERGPHPFVAVNCAALPEQLLESELFGYSEGSFSGAKKGGKMGLFELAHTGTIFLDEIGEMPLSLQAKILRVLQEQEIRRVGGDVVVPIDVRIISATNIDILERIKRGEFRQDLFYRINVLNLQIPALRERPEDIELIFSHYIRRYAAKEKRSVPVIRTGVMQMLKNYQWRGNIRELRNLSERLVIIGDSGVVDTDDVEACCFLYENSFQNPESRDAAAAGSNESLQAAAPRAARSLTQELAESGLSRSEFAGMMGMSRTTLWRKLKEEAEKSSEDRLQFASLTQVK